MSGPSSARGADEDEEHRRATSTPPDHARRPRSRALSHRLPSLEPNPRVRGQPRRAFGTRFRLADRTLSAAKDAYERVGITLAWKTPQPEDRDCQHDDEGSGEQHPRRVSVRASTRHLRLSSATRFHSKCNADMGAPLLKIFTAESHRDHLQRSYILDCRSSLGERCTNRII
jgi:hypothetical protein